MRYLLALLVIAGLAVSVQAHFVFVYISEDGTEARLVFGHTAAPDPAASVARVEKTALTARDATGKESKLTIEKGDGNYYRAKLSGTKPWVVFGTTEAGVTQRGDNPPLLSFYYPKVITALPSKVASLSTNAALDIVPIKDGDRIRFKVSANGKPAADVEVTVGLPGVEREKMPVVKTDKEGLTTSFAGRGRYCVAARRLEEKAGEVSGKKYSAIRHTATLVFDFNSADKWP